jgi:hypothetical protein
MSPGKVAIGIDAQGVDENSGLVTGMHLIMLFNRAICASLVVE